MNTNTHISNGTGKPAESYVWLTCRGCDGDVGIPSSVQSGSVECPGCGSELKINGRVLYQPPKRAVAANEIQATVPSLDLVRKADRIMLLGLSCIVLGWTMIVPFITLVIYLECSEEAGKEKIVTPGKAKFGLVLAVLFGVVQGFMIISFNR
jgi:hypothetical protein